MARPLRLASPVLRFFCCLLVALSCLLVSPARIWAKGCAESLTPYQAPPPSLWGELQPERFLIDATQWTGSQLPNTRYPISTSVDIENGWVFHSFYGGFSIWDARADAANPSRASIVGGFEGQFPGWPSRAGEYTQIAFYIDAPEGNDNFAAIAGISGLGLTIWDTTSKTAPRELYQDPTKYVYQVYAARIAGRDYVFAGDFLTANDLGMHVYDMTAAKSLAATPCVASGGNCPGVYLGRIGAAEASQYVHGLAVGSRHFIVKSGGYNGIAIYDVTNPNPQQAQLVVRDFKGFSNGDTYGVTMFTQNGRHYLAARQGGDGKIFDITTCLTTGCSSLQNLLIWTQPLRPHPDSTYWLSATFSRSGTTPFIYFGNHDTCRNGETPFQTEYLLDVTNPASPRDVTPLNHIVDQGVNVDYWSWYYSDTTRGWAHMGPRVAKFNGQYLYRAAGTIFDVHKWTGGAPAPPVANFTWTDPVYQGDPVTFTSTSTGAVTSYVWTFQDGSPPSTTGSSSAEVTFSSPGAKTVSLTASNLQGPSTSTQSVTVIDPTPAVTDITVSPQNPLACQPVTLTANGLGGRPPVSVNWTVSNGALVVASGSGNPSFTWNSIGSPPGPYTANVTVSKQGFPSVSTSKQVNLGTLPVLPAAGSFTPANDQISLGAVRFHANVPGATEWRWNFGDGWGPWSSNPSDEKDGPNPLHSFTTTGKKTVQVAVRNCVNRGPNDEGYVSAPLEVSITSVEPLNVTLFLAEGCEGPYCDFSPGQTITFRVDTEGIPTGIEYEYDWLGNGFGGANGADDQVSPTKLTHSYAEGTYSPAVRLRRGPDFSPPVTHRVITIRPGAGSGGGGNNNPTVTVSGPSSGQVNTAYSFTATAANCTPGTWSWTGGAGATITGSGTSVSIAWSSAGSKTIVATATGCTSGTKSISITNPGTGTGGLTADFSFSPANPQANQTVTFNAGASTGSPTAYFWEFPGGANDPSGAIVTRSFAAGSHIVKLTVYKDCGGGGCASSASVTKTVVVTGGPPALVADFDTNATCTSDIIGVRCEAQTGQAVTFTSTSTGNPNTFTWTFNDGTPAGSGAQVSHTWNNPGSYLVQLTAGNGQATASTSRLFVVTGPPALAASFNSPNCAGAQCTAQTGQAVSFTSTSTGAATHSWDFGDGTPAVTGAQASHTWNKPGNYTVQLTVNDGKSKATASTSLTFVVTGPPVSQTKSVVLPWIAQTRGALVQSSDLYVHNPGKTAMDVTLEFRKRGVPESSPPRVPRTIEPGATLYVGDVLRDLFNRESVAGFIMVTVDKGDVEPVITSFNTTFQLDGKQFGQTVSGVSMSSAGSASGSGPESRMQHLVGLIDNTERLAYFGLSNPSDEPATYRLRFFDKTGRLIGESAQDLTVSRFGQRQFQVKEIEELFGISNVADYRIEIEKKSGGMIVPYASNLRLSSEDPSFIEPGASKHAKSYLLGTLSAPGLNNSVWQSDLLLTNVNTAAVTAQVTFTSVGLTSVPTTPVSVTLQPGQTERLENVIAGRWNIRDAVGVLTVTSSSSNGVFPIVQGESYESTNTDPAKRFGQSMTALSDADAAGAGQSQYLVGMRQDAKNRTTIWIFNPDTVTAEYDIIYRPLGGGAPLGTVPGVRLGAGKMRQFSPGQHPIPAAGVANGFTVEIVVKSGKVLSSAQVINNITNDPAYIQGEAR